MASQLCISQSYYNKIESGKKQLTVQTFIDIAAILDIDKGEIFQQQKANSIIGSVLSEVQNVSST